MSHSNTIQGWLLAALFTLMAAMPVMSYSTVAHAQEDEVDAYDPFIDYSEYEEANDEEADINFFRNGRFLTMGFAIGQRTFTEGMRGFYKDDVAFGLYLSYFFDLRFALQFGYMTGGHAFHVPASSPAASGDADISALSVDIKYYLNTQNVTKGLASFNPYLLGGFSSISRKINLSGTADIADDRANAFDLGAGIEFPMLRNKMYMGGQALYQLVSFKDENVDQGSNHFMNGDLITYTAILGVNF